MRRITLVSVVAILSLAGWAAPAEAAGEPVGYGGRIAYGAMRDAVGIEVTVYRQSGDDWVVDQTVTSDTVGRYGFTGDRDAVYKLKYHDPTGRLRDQYWHDKTDLDSADGLRLGGVSEYSSVYLWDGSQISGQVTDEAGGPIPYAYVHLYARDASGAWTKQASETVDDTGQYLFGGLSAGVYRLAFIDEFSGHLTEYGDDASTIESGADVVVGENVTVGHQDASLVKGGSISGTVRLEDGSPARSIYVTAYRKSADGWERVSGALSSTEGRYTVKRLPTGTYRLRFGETGGTHWPEFWPDQRTIEDARDLDVAIRENVADVDATVALAGRLSTRSTPRLEAAPRVGEPITAFPGTWNVPDATLTYQWYSGCSSCRIEGATERTFTPTPDLVHRTVWVVVGASREGYNDAWEASPRAEVLPALHQLTPSAPVVTGTAQPDQVLTARITTPWSTVPLLTTHHQWLLDGTPIAGATASTLRVPRTAVGRTVTVRVTGSVDWFRSESAVSSPRLITAAGFSRSPAPKVLGTPLVGRTLRASVGTWSPAPSRLTYRWHANGKAIAGATRATLKLPVRLRGQRITVVVTASTPGYATTTRTSTRTAKVGR